MPSCEETLRVMGQKDREAQQISGEESPYTVGPLSAAMIKDIKSYVSRDRKQPI